LSTSQPTPSPETTFTTTTLQEEKARDVNVPAAPVLDNDGTGSSRADGNGGTAAACDLVSEVVVNDTPRDGDGNGAHDQEAAECGEPRSVDEPPSRAEIRRRMPEVGFEVAPRRKGRKAVDDIIRDFGKEACWYGL
jgi:hypothetical protein